MCHYNIIKCWLVVVPFKTISNCLEVGSQVSYSLPEVKNNIDCRVNVPTFFKGVFMSFYRVVFRDARPDYIFIDPSILSRYVIGDRFRPDVSDIIIDIV